MLTIRNSREYHDEDYEIIDGKRVLKDGKTFRHPMHFMDGGSRNLARHQPGFASECLDLVSDAEHQRAYDAANDAYDARSAAYQDAWQQQSEEAPANAGTSNDAAEKAWDDRDDYLTNAWRSPA